MAIMLTFAKGQRRRSARDGSEQPRIEALEQRALFSGAHLAYPPDAIVEDHLISRWVAKWWTKVFQTKVHASDGTTILNPMLSDTTASSQGKADGVYYLFGSFFGGSHSRSATVSSGTPIFVPILPIEFSNFDTTTGNDPSGTFPGHNTAAQLSDFAAQAAVPALGPGGELHLSVDGRSLLNPGSYREIAPTFSYVLPQTDNVDQFFFGNPDLKGLVSPVEADGFYAMLRPLSPGTHVIHFGGSTPGGSLGPLNVDVTYTITIVSEEQNTQRAPALESSAQRASTPFSTTRLSSWGQADDPLHKGSAESLLA